MVLGCGERVKGTGRGQGQGSRVRVMWIEEYLCYHAIARGQDERWSTTGVYESRLRTIYTG